MESIDSINTTGFNRSFSGKHGKQTYFPRLSLYCQ